MITLEMLLGALAAIGALMAWTRFSSRGRVDLNEGGRLLIVALSSEDTDDIGRVVEAARAGVSHYKRTVPGIVARWRMILASGLLLQGSLTSFDEAQALSGSLLDDPGMPKSLRVVVANQLAWAVASGVGPNDRSDLAMAESRARLACDLFGWEAGLQDTLALVLIRRRRFDEARRLADRVASEISDRPPKDRASVACVQALAALGQGDMDEARSHYEAALILDPHCRFLGEVAAGLGPTP